MKALRLCWEIACAFWTEALAVLGVLGALFMVTWAMTASARREVAKPGAVRVIDGCQYIEFSTYSGYVGLTHKGNCTNAIHVYREL